MNSKPDYPIELFLHWRAQQIHIPLDWTPLQADTVITTLGQIEERIWILYGDDLINLAKAATYIRSPTDTDHDTDDDIPF
jgi:hypothetical protein